MNLSAGPQFVFVANKSYRASKEQERLEKNKERRKKREKQKKLQQKIREGGGAGDEGSPEPSTEKVTGTTRKCANCGQVGHIKTNKKYVCFCIQDSHEASEIDMPRQSGSSKPRKSGKRSSWRPTQEPRVEGDKILGPTLLGVKRL
jgi:transcription initiation factor TFIID subunit 1